MTAPEHAAMNAAHAEALRYVLARLDDAEGRPSAVPVDQLSPGGMVALAMLVTGARRAAAQLRGISDPAEQSAVVRSMLESELEEAEMRTAFDAVEAEMDESPLPDA